MTLIAMDAILRNPMTMIVLCIIIMYFFMFRPQSKQRKALETWRKQIAIGTQVVTAGGVYGEVRSIDETNNILYVEIAKGVQIRIDRNSVFQTVQRNA